MLNYEVTKKHLPAGSTTPTGGQQGPYMSTWTVDILPLMEEQALYDKWLPNYAIESLRNQEIQQAILPTFICPSDVDTATLIKPETGPGLAYFWAPGSYRANSGVAQVPGAPAGCNRYWDDPSGAESMPIVTRGPIHTHALDSNSRLEVKLSQIVDGTSKTRSSASITRKHTSRGARFGPMRTHPTTSRAASRRAVR